VRVGDALIPALEVLMWVRVESLGVTLPSTHHFLYICHVLFFNLSPRIIPQVRKQITPTVATILSFLFKKGPSHRVAFCRLWKGTNRDIFPRNYDHMGYFWLWFISRGDPHSSSKSGPSGTV
jgi:hypothetical protein